MNKDRREILSTMSAFGLAALPVKAWSSGARASNIATIEGHAFGTTWHFVIDEERAEKTALEIIRRTLQLIDQSMSPYVPHSEVSLFNQSSAKQQVLSRWCEPVVSASLAVARASGGAFDPTVGPRVNTFGFGPIEGSTDCRYTDLNLQGMVLSKQVKGATIDLCGIAKGHALDLITESLVKHGYSDFLFELGGEIRVDGIHPLGRAWSIGLDTPPGYKMLKTPMPQGSHAVATSGEVQQSFQFNNQQQSHLIDPLTVASKPNTIYSVSVFHPNAMMADAWSTALYVMGRNKAIECAHQNKLNTAIMGNKESDYDLVCTGSINLKMGAI